MRGLRVHITGSAAIDCDSGSLKNAHAFVQKLTDEVIARGGGLVLGAGGEPRGDSGEPCIFDWTALAVVADSPDPATAWPMERAERFVVVATQRGLEKIPEWRDEVWQKCKRRTDFGLEPTPPGWRGAGVVRERQVRRGDVLLALGGGAGAEQLAELYREEGKPVVPIMAELGAIDLDGNGGSRYLHGRALGETDAFFRLRDGIGSAAARLSCLTLNAASDVAALAKETADLLADLRPRTAFYVRLLATDHADYPAVERFFREVVDDVVTMRGFTPREMGRGKPEAAFMNVEIFEALHRASLVVVDLTGVRPNCAMELGYALGRRRRVVLSAKAGTTRLFDSDKLPTYSWEDAGKRAKRVEAYGNWLDQYIELSPLVK